jgi:ribulose-5-phosphate 4-epimerase/fuculose-1-phosphate aldolase
MAVVHGLEPLQAQIARTRADLAAAFQLAARLQMNEGIDNHFTARVPGTADRFFINPKPLHWSEIRASDVLVVDADGAVVEGDLKPARSGPSIHIPIHQAHPRGTCVFHLHMPWSTALTAVRGGRLEMVHQNSARFFEDVAYDDDFSGIALDQAEGRRLARAFGDKSVLFLANHGVIAAAETIAEAFDVLYFVERASQVQVLAMSTGRPLNVMSDAMARQTRAAYQGAPVWARQHFEALKRAYLDREGSAYAS